MTFICNVSNYFLKSKKKKKNLHAIKRARGLIVVIPQDIAVITIVILLFCKVSIKIYVSDINIAHLRVASC